MAISLLVSDTRTCRGCGRNAWRAGTLDQVSDSTITSFFPEPILIDSCRGSIQGANFFHRANADADKPCGVSRLTARVSATGISAPWTRIDCGPQFSVARITDSLLCAYEYHAFHRG